MVIGYPRGGVFPRDPHSGRRNHRARISPAAWSTARCTRRSSRNLRGIALHEADAYAAFNTGFIVYHDDLGDYSTNEPIMDGTASLMYLLATLDLTMR